MFELPEVTLLARQINSTLKGKAVRTGNLGNSPHKFVWYNRTEEEFASLVAGKVVGEAFSQGRWLFIPLEPGFILLFGEFGGKLLCHQAGEKPPKKVHLQVDFEDGSCLTEFTQMWGAMELYSAADVWERKYVKNMRTPPLDDNFTFEYFSQLIEDASRVQKTSAKGLLTQNQLIPGLGNACAQDILFNARVHPRQNIAEMPAETHQNLYHAIQTTLTAIIEGGGRYDEVDLFGKPGGYIRMMDKNAVGKPCPVCGTPIEKFAYLGGACYVCPACQPFG